MEYWIEAEGAGHYFFYIFPVCLLVLFLVFKVYRVRFIIPSVLISILIINPWFYQKWDELGHYAYWRVLWVVPVVPVIAALVSVMADKIAAAVTNKANKERWRTRIPAASKLAMVGFAIVGIVIGGTFIYKTERSGFEGSTNATKLPNNIVRIADRLLKLKNHPCVIFQYPLGIYVRQYTGEIDSMFGRDMDGHITYPSKTERSTYELLNNQETDLSTIKQLMLDDGYDYVVVAEGREMGDGFELIDLIEGFEIYKPIGNPKLLKKRNELGQIISITQLDDFGVPINGGDNVSTVTYGYDDRNNTVYEFRTDKNGIGVVNCNGAAGFIKEYDLNNCVIREILLGANGKPTRGLCGYAEVRRTYKDKQIVSECYYDEKGAPTNNSLGFSYYTTQYDNFGILESRFYYDTNGDLTNREDGYSKVVSSGQDFLFYDKNGTSVSSEGINLFIEIATDSDGWSEWITPRQYYHNFNFVLETINLGMKSVGDRYNCQIEIEFKDVEVCDGQSFLFRTQGTVDGRWDIANPWNDVVSIADPPQDGIYHYAKGVTINNQMAGARNYQIGFRCDNWESGSFRVRKIKIEKNQTLGEWGPGI